MAVITIKDIAKECGVGVSTVSRAINDHADINPDTKKLILATIDRLGYVPNNSARNLKRTEANTIAVLIKGITNPFFSDMIKVIEKETEKRKYSLELKHVEYYEDEVVVAQNLIKEKRLKGIVFLGGYFTHSEEKLGQLTVPYIFGAIGSSVPENISKASYSSVAVDDRKESYRMTKYLLGKGHREIVFLTTVDEKDSIGQLRLEGYKQALQEAEIPFREELVSHVKNMEDPYSILGGYIAAQELLASGSKFTALFAVTDLLAMGACRALIEAGRKIPDEISVVGFDGIELGKYYNPSITTISQPIQQMAKKTIDLLFDLIAGYKEYEHIVFPAELVERESSGKVHG